MTAVNSTLGDGPMWAEVCRTGADTTEATVSSPLLTVTWLLAGDGDRARLAGMLRQVADTLVES